MKIYLALGTYFIFISFALAQLSPGDLSDPHTHLTGIKNCTKCHELGKKVIPAKCLDCHVLLKERIQSGKGLHSRTEFSNCTECHSDHQGKEFDLIWWKEGKDNFDHSKTGYLLEGKHLSLDCRKCHNSKNIADKQKYLSQNKNLDKTYLGLEKDCLNCHHNEHRSQLDDRCLQCHDLNGWKPASLFDHNRSNYPLRGKHTSVNCILCHKKIEDKSNDRDQDYLKFTGLTFKNCSDCHRAPHHGRLGSSCTKCHKVTGWIGLSVTNFDHDRTRFPLRGKHRGITCNKCHHSSQSINRTSEGQCSSCHNDYHQGQFNQRPQKGACDECHTVEGFIPAKFSINQHNETNYPLVGAHLAVPCNLCHQRNYRGTIRYRFSSTECESCHRDPRLLASPCWPCRKYPLDKISCTQRWSGCSVLIGRYKLSHNSSSGSNAWL